MEQLSKIAYRAAGKYTLKPEMESSLILSKTNQMITDTWGEKGEQNLKPQKMIANRLFIQAANSAWSQELQLHKHQFLKKLNAFEIKKIMDIRIMIG